MILDREKCIAFGKDPDFLIEKLKPINDNLSRRIIKSFNKERDKNNFISTLAELKFVHQFNEIGFNIEYEKKYKLKSGEKTPDLTLELNGKNFIGEVYRLGSSEKDDKITQFIDKVGDVLSGIESDYLLLMEFKNKSYDFIDFDFNHFEDSIEIWIRNKPRLNDVLNYNSGIDFVVLHKGNWVTTQLISDPIIMNIKSEKLTQKEYLSDNEITKKILKYKEIIKQREVPYFLCIETDFNSGFHFSEFSERFHHFETDVVDFEKNKEIWLMMGKGKCWSVLGDFYKYPFLSGILILLNNEYKLLLSPLKSQVIYEKRYEPILKKITQRFTLI